MSIQKASQLVRVTPESHGVILDIRYASSNNFVGRPVYKQAICLVHPDADKGLRHLISLAALAGYKVKLFDCYRPHEAQGVFWEATPDKNYLADVSLGSNHSRGTAIDLTLVDEHGNDLDMGTDFDAMTELSHHEQPGLSVEVQRNRLLLLGIMRQAGFLPIRTEWWHYELPNSRATYPLLEDDVIGILA